MMKAYKTLKIDSVASFIPLIEGFFFHDCGEHYSSENLRMHKRNTGNTEKLGTSK